MGRSLLLFLLLALLLLLDGVHANAKGRIRFSGRDHDDDDDDERRHQDEDDEDEQREHREHQHHRHHDDEDEGEGAKERCNPFILKKPVEVVKTQAGSIHVLPGLKEKGGVLALKNIGLNFVTMEPKGMLLPQYIDAPFVLYVFKGKMRLGLIDGNDLRHVDMQEGDIFVVPGGLVFYMLNVGEAQRLRVFGIFDTSESLQTGHFQSIFIAGGIDPKSTLSGFDREVLAAAFKVSSEEVSDILGNQNDGPIIYTSKARSVVEESSSWPWVNLASKFIKYYNDNKRKAKGPGPFNLLKKKPDFENANGKTVAINGKEYASLRKADVGVFAVTLKPAAVLAPHWNPRAAEVAVVTGGQGIIQISYPNGTTALDERVDEGTVFFVPRYFPMCQIATREGQFQFVGFSTSSKPNNPQFLAGSTSVLQALDEETLSMSFGLKQERLKDLLNRQKDAVILPGFIEKDRRE